MKHRVIFCLAFVFVLGMVKQTYDTNPGNSKEAMQFQEVNIGFGNFSLLQEMT